VRRILLLDVCSAKVKFVGVQVFSGFLSVIVVQQVCRDFIVGWTYSTQNELAFLSSLCAVKGLGYVVLRKLLSGSGYRLRATSKIGKVTRDSDVLAIFGVSLAPACRAGRGDG
jgi:hypothetical protein